MRSTHGGSSSSVRVIWGRRAPAGVRGGRRGAGQRRFRLALPDEPDEPEPPGLPVPGRAPFGGVPSPASPSPASPSAAAGGVEGAAPPSEPAVAAPSPAGAAGGFRRRPPLPRTGLAPGLGASTLGSRVARSASAAALAAGDPGGGGSFLRM